MLNAQYFYNKSLVTGYGGQKTNFNGGLRLELVTTCYL